MTNLEKIRQMSAEELENFMHNYYRSCGRCAFCFTEKCEKDTCEKGAIAWLNSEAKE